LWEHYKEGVFYNADHTCNSSFRITSIPQTLITGPQTGYSPSI